MLLVESLSIVNNVQTQLKSVHYLVDLAPTGMIF